MIETPTKTKDLETQALIFLDQLKGVQITTSADYQAASTLLREIKTRRKTIDDFFDPQIKQAHELHKGLVSQKKQVESRYIEAENLVKSRIADYLAEEERKRKEEELRIQAELKRQQEEQILQEAAALEEAGFKEAAEEVLNAPVIAPPVIFPTTPKADGVYTTSRWKAVIVDLRALVQHVSAHPEHLNLLLPNETALNGLARSLKQNMRIPGVQAIEEKSVSARINGVAR